MVYTKEIDILKLSKSIFPATILFLPKNILIVNQFIFLKIFSFRHPTGGSFVKQNKVDFGVDIWKAIEEKYFEEESGLSTATEDKDQDHLLYNNLE